MISSINNEASSGINSVYLICIRAGPKVEILWKVYDFEQHISSEDFGVTPSTPSPILSKMRFLGLGGKREKLDEVDEVEPPISMVVPLSTTDQVRINLAPVDVV